MSFISKTCFTSFPSSGMNFSNMSQAFDWIGGPTTGYFTKEVMFNIVLIEENFSVVQA